MNINVFRICLLVPLAYTVFISILLPTLAKIPEAESLSPGNPASYFFIAYLLCYIYCLRFNAESIRSVENKGPVRYSEFQGEFFQLLIFPIGIWTLQPKINLIIKELS
jgi:hypothetical protein